MHALGVSAWLKSSSRIPIPPSNPIHPDPHPHAHVQSSYFFFFLFSSLAPFFLFLIVRRIRLIEVKVPLPVCTIVSGCWSLHLIWPLSTSSNHLPPYQTTFHLVQHLPPYQTTFHFVQHLPPYQTTFHQSSNSDSTGALFTPSHCSKTFQISAGFFSFFIAR